METNSYRTDARVVLDARYLTGQQSGIGHYTESIVREMLKLDREIRFHLVTHPKNPDPIEHPRITTETFSAPADSPQTRFLDWFVDVESGDLFHSAFNFLPGAFDVPTLFTLHDIMWLLDAHYLDHRWWRKWISGPFNEYVVSRSVSEADRILAVSNSSRDDIEDYFPESRGKIDVIYNGVDPFFEPVEPREGWSLVDDFLPPQSKFVLAVGKEAPYKNHYGALAGFIEAFRDDPEVYFVLVCRLGNPSRRLRKLLEDPQVAPRIISPGYVSREQLRALYSLARTFLFPSLYEGFGLPILEAMACGTPVVTSDRGAPAEVGDAAALRVDPESPEAIGEALQKLMRDDAFYERKRREGFEHVERFTWRQCAEETLKVYRTLLRGQ